MTKDRIEIEVDGIDDVDRVLTPLGWFYMHNAMDAARPRWCSTSSAGVLGVLSLAFGNRTPERLHRTVASRAACPIATLDEAAMTQRMCWSLRSHNST